MDQSTHEESYTRPLNPEDLRSPGLQTSLVRQMRVSKIRRSDGDGEHERCEGDLVENGAGCRGRRAMRSGESALSCFGIIQDSL